MGYTVSQIRLLDGETRPFIAATPENIQVYNAATRNVENMTRDWKFSQWVAFGSTLGVLVCTLSLIGCAADGCFDSEENQIVKSVCASICDDGVRMASIIGECVFGVVMIASCILMCNTQR